MSELENTGVNECLAHYIAHSETLMKSEKRLDRIEDTIKSMPSEIQAIKETINKLSDNMEKLLEKLEAKYVSKELYETHITNIMKTYADYKADTDKEISSLHRKLDYMFKGLLLACLYVLKDVIYKVLHI